MFIENQELDRLKLDEGTINQNNYDSSSPEGTPSSSSSSACPVPRNVVMERRRRQLVNDKLKALRSVVPTITKWDKASIIKDAIDYIQVLQEQEKRIDEEIKELERVITDNHNDKGEMPVVGADLISLQLDHEVVRDSASRKKKKRAKSSVMASESPWNSSIEVMEIKVCHIGERTFAVSITCGKKRQTTVNVCELFQSLNLKVINASISSISGCLQHILLVESEEPNNTQLKELVERGIAELNAERTESLLYMSF